MLTQSQEKQQSRTNAGALQSVTQALVFPSGTYRFFVQAASPTINAHLNLPFPALLVAAGPGVAPGAVEFVGKPSAVSAWLCNSGDNVTIKVVGGNASLVISSLRTPDTTTTPFEIKVEQLDATPSAQTTPTASRTPSLKLQIGVHVGGKKDAQLVTNDWAGRAGSGVWIEAITIKPQEILTPADIEYKGLSANGFETPWLSDGAVCGTKGANTPLVGFAARLKPQVAAQYDCEYSIAFRSGIVVGPVRNGVPARSKTAGDAIEAIEIRVVHRASFSGTNTATKIEVSTEKAAAKSMVKKNSKFGAFREEEAPAAKPVSKNKKISAPAIVKPAEKSRKPEKKVAPPAKLVKKAASKKIAPKRK